MAWGSSSPRWPLATAPKPWTWGGRFSAHRDDDDGDRQHQGVDLGTPYETPVLAVDDGIIVQTQGWSGSGTRGLWVDHPGAGYTALYGAIKPGSNLPIGTAVKRGQTIAVVGKYPKGSTMLHWEAWKLGTRKPRARWSEGKPRPADNYDPSDYLKLAMSPADAASSPSSGEGTQTGGGGGGGGGVALALMLLTGVGVGVGLALRRRNR